MSKIGVSIKIDVSKIEEARLFKGAKGTYLDVTAFIDLDELDQYGNSGMITQDVSKAEKEAGTRGPILGNTKVFWSEGRQAPQAAPAAAAPTPGGPGPENDFDDDIPFAPPFAFMA